MVTKMNAFVSDQDRKGSLMDSRKSSMRPLSKISTIPEEGNEEDFPDNASNQMSNNNREDCCTPPLLNQPLLARAVQVPNRIRRLRSRNQKNNQQPKNLWFTGTKILEFMFLDFSSKLVM